MERAQAVAAQKKLYFRQAAWKKRTIQALRSLPQSLCSRLQMIPLGCDEMVLLSVCALFGVFLQPVISNAAQITKAAALILLLIFFAPFKRINISLSVYDS